MEGKEKVIDGVALTDRRAIPGVVGVVDADWDRLERREVPRNVFPTDTHDLESMLLFSGALALTGSYAPGFLIGGVPENFGISARLPGSPLIPAFPLTRGKGWKS